MFRIYVLGAALAALLAAGCSTTPQTAAPAKASASFAVIPPKYGFVNATAQELALKPIP